MDFKFTAEDINKITQILDTPIINFENGWSWQLKNQQLKQGLVLTIYGNAQLDSNTVGILISVQTQHGYFELHGCTAYMTFEPDEIIFVDSRDAKVSSLIISKYGNCSLYSNINKDILNSDFSKLDSAVLLAAMQLSLTEGIL